MRKQFLKPADIHYLTKKSESLVAGKPSEIHELAAMNFDQFN